MLQAAKEAGIRPSALSDRAQGCYQKEELGLGHNEKRAVRLFTLDDHGQFNPRNKSKTNHLRG